MKHRLVWNFSIDDDNPLDIGQLPEEDGEALRWEARYFWPENEDIILHGLNSSYLDLTRYTLKHRPDAYYLLADSPYNIKQRRGEILYKPLMEKRDACLAFGKKLNLYEHASEQTLPGIPAITAAELLESIQQQGRIISAEKSALVYKFASKPGIKLELARLTIAGRVFFTACVEGRSYKLVNLISKHLLNQQISCDYVTFLKQIALP